MLKTIANCWFFAFAGLLAVAYLVMAVSVGIGMFKDGHTVFAVPVSLGLSLAGTSQAILLVRKEKRRRRLQAGMEREINRLKVEIALSKAFLAQMRSGN